MPVSDNELAQAVALIAHDPCGHPRLGSATSRDPRRGIRRRERRRLGCGLGSYAIKLAEDVQQQLHDTFVDTTWPACPLHPHHPLWLDSEHDRAVWRCTQAGMDIAPLGSLTSST